MSASHQLFPPPDVDGIVWRGYALKSSDDERGVGPDYSHEGEEVGLWVSQERDGTWSAAIEAAQLMSEGEGDTAHEALEHALDLLLALLEGTRLTIERCFPEPST